MEQLSKMDSPYAGMFLSLLCVLVLADSGVFADKKVVKLTNDGNTHHLIRKRSTSPNPHNTFPASLATVCSVVSSNIDVKHNKTISNPQDEKWREPVLNWPLPPVYPTSVKASRKSKKEVKFTFNVKHSSDVIASSIGSIDYREKALNYTRKFPRTPPSAVDFYEDTSRCKIKDPKYHHTAEFLFSLVTNAYVVRVSVDICRYGWEFSGDSKFFVSSYRKWSWSSPFKEYIPVPRFQILPDPGDKIYIHKGKNPTFDVEVDFHQSFNFTAHVTLWDWSSYKYVTDDVRMDGKDFIPESFQTWNRGPSQNKGSERLLSIKLLAITFNNSNVDDVWDDEKSDVRAKIRISMNLGSKRMSGKLVLGHHWRETRWYARPIVRGVSTYRTISMKLPYKTTIFPANKIEVVGGEFDCDEHGNRGRPKHHMNCTIECHAYGTNISSIFIFKASSPYQVPVKSTHFFTQDAAHVIHDMGPASEDNAGLYRCVVIPENKMVKTAHINLHVAGFTQITNLTSEDLKNSTHRFVCSTDGDGPLNMSISLSDENGNYKERIDNKIGNLAYYETTENNKTNYIVLLCYDQVQVPALNLITCEAKGPRGQDSKTLTLPRKHRDVCYSPFPKLKRDESNVTWSRWSSVSDPLLDVFCSAIGGKDLDMLLAYGGPEERYRIDNSNDIRVKKVLDTDDGKILNLEPPFDLVRTPWTTVYCGAKNKYGIDWIGFSLLDLDV